MIRRLHVSATRAIRSALVAMHALDLDHVPGSRAALYLRSLLAIYDPEDLARLGLAWWTFGAQDHVSRWLASRKTPARVFEFGAGASTRWLAARGCRVTAVEHDDTYLDSLRAIIGDTPGVTLLVRTPVKRPGLEGVRSMRAGWEDFDFASYVATLAEVGGPFDLIVIDGRARNACLAIAPKHLAAGGLVLFDDSNRSRYRQALADCPLPRRVFRGLTPSIPYPAETTILGPCPS